MRLHGQNGILLGLIFALISILQSCNGYQKVLKSSDFEFKMEKAKEYYNAGDYVKALPLFEELMTVYKGTKDVEKLYFFYPFCHYGLGDYLIASYYFENFLEYYPRSEHAEEARFMNAFCFYKMSPNHKLEQTSTAKAMDAFQYFVNSFPESEKIEESNQLMDELRQKLEEKAIYGANLYFNMRDYRAAAVAFNNVLSDFPETENREEMEFQVIKSYYLLAENSVADKQLERYQNAVDHYLTFIDRYKTSDFLKEAERIYTVSVDEIDRLNSNIN